MPELNIICTNTADPTGAQGLWQQPLMETTESGYTYGALSKPAGHGFMEFGSGTPGSLPFKVDQDGKVTGSFHGSTDTSGTAAATAPVFTSGVALQLNTVQDVILYIAVQTAAALAVAIGPDSGTADTIMPSQSYALSLATIRVPKGWYVSITGTIADLAITAVTC